MARDDERLEREALAKVSAGTRELEGVSFVFRPILPATFPPYLHEMTQEEVLEGIVVSLLAGRVGIDHVSRGLGSRLEPKTDDAPTESILIHISQALGNLASGQPVEPNEDLQNWFSANAQDDWPGIT